jgi:hypothetical protein
MRDFAKGADARHRCAGIREFEVLELDDFELHRRHQIRHCERSEAIQGSKNELDCFLLRSSSFGGRSRRKSSSQ